MEKKQPHFQKSMRNNIPGPFHGMGFAESMLWDIDRKTHAFSYDKIR